MKALIITACLVLALQQAGRAQTARIANRSHSGAARHAATTNGGFGLPEKPPAKKAVKAKQSDTIATKPFGTAADTLAPKPVTKYTKKHRRKKPRVSKSA